MKLATLRNLDVAYQAKNVYEDGIVKSLEKEYKRAYDEYRNELPPSKCEIIAKTMMLIKKFEKEEYLRVLYPYLNDL